MNIQEQLLNIEKEALAKISEAANHPELNDIRAFYTGKKSPLGEIMKSMATLTIDEKKIVGKLANEVKGRIEAAVAERRTYLEQEEVNKKLAEVVPKQQQIRKELEEIIKELEVDYHE